jgi:hypothetical protein
MEAVEAQGQAMARQMAQIANLLKNALRIQPSPTPIPNDNQYASSASGTLVPLEDQQPSSSTPVSIQAAPTARVMDRSYSTTTSVASSLPPTPYQPHLDLQVSMTAHSRTLGDALFCTDPCPLLGSGKDSEITNIIDDDKQHLTVTTPKAAPLKIGPTLEDQYVAVNYTSVRFPGWEHGGIRPVQIHTLDHPFHRTSREQSLGIPLKPKANVQAPLSGCPLPGLQEDAWEDRNFHAWGLPGFRYCHPFICRSLPTPTGPVVSSHRNDTLTLPRG